MHQWIKKRNKKTHTNLNVSVICCGFVKLLSQFERNFSVFEGAQRLYDNFVILMTYDNCGFGNIAYLPSGKTNTYGGKNNNQKLLKYNINCIENLMHSNTLDCTIAPCTCKVIRGILSFCKKISYFYLPSAFMYSSKFWLSTSFQVAQNASTILRVWNAVMKHSCPWTVTEFTVSPGFAESKAQTN